MTATSLSGPRVRARESHRPPHTAGGARCAAGSRRAPRTPRLHTSHRIDHRRRCRTRWPLANRFTRQARRQHRCGDCLRR
jgi:hypothetical protein